MSLVKRMTLLQRRADLSFDRFDRHWAGPHGEIARRFPGLARYHQNTVETPLTANRHRLDGIVELWFAGETEMAQALASPVSGKLVADEPNFLSGITILAVAEDILKAAPGDPDLFAIVDEGALPDAALSAWASDLATRRGITGVTLNRVIRSSARDGLRALSPAPMTVLSLSGPALPAPSEFETIGASAYAVRRRRVV